jgi:hypothetical protein
MINLVLLIEEIIVYSSRARLRKSCLVHRLHVATRTKCGTFRFGGLDQNCLELIVLVPFCQDILEAMDHIQR